MPHIDLPHEPGIIAPLTAYRDSEKPLDHLANVVMCGPSSLTRAEREMIATFVSSGNECYFCTNSHAAAARHLMPETPTLMADVLCDAATANVSDKMKALLVIADHVRRDGRTVTTEHVAQARAAGADDKAIHDTVLIAAMFCMFNRYVEGLGTWQPQDPDLYDQIGWRIANKGYGSKFREDDGAVG